LLGASTIADVVPEMVDATSLSSHSSPPSDELYMANCGWFVVDLRRECD